MTSSFDGKVIAITGGASGIGLAAAKILASRDATLVLADTNQAGLEDAIKSLPGSGRNHTSTVVDVGDSKAVDAWIKKTISEHGRLDGAANLAGVIRIHRPIKDETDDVWDFTMRVNSTGVFNCLRAELNVMKDGASIVNASSPGSHRSFVGLGSYNASKAAVNLLTKTAARENPGIRVNAVSPGTTASPMMKAIEKEGHTLDPLGACIRRQADPSEIAQGVVFLLSEEASFITGTIFDVDGGWMA